LRRDYGRLKQREMPHLLGQLVVLLLVLVSEQALALDLEAVAVEAVAPHQRCLNPPRPWKRRITWTFWVTARSLSCRT
jgi:hypothetical protein